MILFSVVLADVLFNWVHCVSGKFLVFIFFDLVYAYCQIHILFTQNSDRNRRI